jgi:hypothetical protein
MPGPTLLTQVAASMRPIGRSAVTRMTTTSALRIRVALVEILDVQLPVAAGRVDLEVIRTGAHPEA